MKKNNIFLLIAIIFFSYGNAKSNLLKKVNRSDISSNATMHLSYSPKNYHLLSLDSEKLLKDSALDKKIEKSNTIIPFSTLSAMIKGENEVKPKAVVEGKKDNQRSFEPLTLNNNFGDGESTTQRRISWQTPADLAGKMELKESFVEIKENDDDEWKTFPSIRTGKMDVRVGKRNYTHVDIKDLEAGKTYTYRVAHKYSEKDGKVYTYYSKPYEFTTAKSLEEQKNFEFIHFADSQSADGKQYEDYFGNAINVALERHSNTAFAIHTGDMIETNSHWKYAFKAIGDKFSNRAFIPVPGNHEGSTGTRIGATAFGFSEKEYKWNTSFTYGDVLFIGLNSERHSSSDLKKQSDYIREKVKDNKDKTVIIYMHRSPFGGFHYNEQDLINIRRYLVPTLNELNVSLVIGGHDHNHFRNYPIKNDPTKNGKFIFKQPSEMDNENIINTKNDGTIYLTEFNNGQKTYTKYNGSNKGTHFNHFGLLKKSEMAPKNSAYTHIQVEGKNLKVTSYLVSGKKLTEFTIINDEGEKPINVEPIKEKEDPRSFEPLTLNNNFGDGESTSQRRISWQTPSNLAGKMELKESFVEIKEGDEWKNYPSIRTGKMSTRVGERNYTHVDIKDLEAGKTYTYRVAHKYSEKDGKVYTYYSKPYEFTTAKSLEEQKNFEFIHFADSQSADGEQYEQYFGNAINVALEKHSNTAFAIHTGDMIETNSHWKYAFKAIGDKFSNRAFIPVPGNHEGSTGTRIGATAFGFGEKEYKWNTSFTYGDVLFIGLNSERHSSSDLKKQSDYIREKVKDNKDKTVIIYMHRSPFGGFHYNEQDLINIRRYLVPTLNELNVSLVIGGHDHNHFRNHPIKNDPTKNGKFIFKQPSEMDNENIINTKNDGTIYLTEFNNGQKTYTKYNGSNKGTHFNHFGLLKKSEMAPKNSAYTHIQVEGKNLKVTSYLVSGKILTEFTIINEETKKDNDEAKAEEAMIAVATASVEKIGLNNFNIYPNPTDDTFTINFESNSNSDIIISIHDLNGKLILNQTYKNTGRFSQEISLNNVQSGVYSVTIEDGKNKEVKKIVKK